MASSQTALTPETEKQKTPAIARDKRISRFRVKQEQSSRPPRIPQRMWGAAVW
jgi:hypothetical protein